MQQEDRLQPISKRHQASIINFQIKARNCNTQKRGGAWQAILSYCQKVDFQGHHIPIYNPEVSIKWSWSAWLSKSLGRRRLDCKEDLGHQATRTGHLLLRNLSSRLPAFGDNQNHTLSQPYPLLGSNSYFALTEKRLNNAAGRALLSAPQGLCRMAFLFPITPFTYTCVHPSPPLLTLLF